MQNTPVNVTPAALQLPTTTALTTPTTPPMTRVQSVQSSGALAVTAGVTGPASALATQLVSYVVSAQDSSPIDQNIGFSYRINWGDGTPARVIPQSMW